METLIAGVEGIFSLCLTCLVSRKRNGEERPTFGEGEGGGQV